MFLLLENVKSAAPLNREYTIIINSAAYKSIKTLLSVFFTELVFWLQIAKNNGCVTISHFGRILYFLKINLSVEDFQLLVNKFLKDGYTVNYMAFLAALEYIYECMEENGITDVGGVSVKCIDMLEVTG